MSNLGNKRLFVEKEKKITPASNFYREVFLRNKNERERFREYISEGDNYAKEIAKHAAYQLYYLHNIKNFRDSKKLRNSFSVFFNLFVKRGLVKGWQHIETKDDYLDALRSVIQHPQSKVYMWGTLRFHDYEPRIGFISTNGSEKTSIWVTVKDGYIENAEPGITWQDILNVRLTYYPYEINILK